MPKYKVPATITTELFIEVEANNPDEAWGIAKKADGSDFLEEPMTGSWDIGEPQLMKEEG